MKGMLILVAVALAAAPGIRDIDGRELHPMHPAGRAEVLFFVTSDCPISNFYAPEIQRICGEYRGKGVSCALVYVDSEMDTAAVRKHLNDFRYASIPAILDIRHTLIDAAGATVTPQAVVIGHDGKVRYSGRIDNFYAGLGKPRRQATTHDLRAALDEMLAGKPVTTPKTEPVGCFIPRPGVVPPSR
jgi:thiol-disulfide isomerase/thioredoxin